MVETQSPLAFVGTSTDGEGDGIYRYRQDPASGDLTALGTTDGGENPTFLTVHPDGEHLYAVNEVGGGSATAFEIDREAGDLRELNRQPVGADGPCHCSVDAAGEYLLTANYGGGSVSMLPVRDDGRLGEPADVVEHEGGGVDPDRQTEPRPHSATVGPANRFAYVADLGTDEVVVYEIDREAGRLRAADCSPIEVRAGVGPRHLDFHPDGEFAYLVGELESVLVAYRRDAETGALEAVQTAGTLPEDFDGDNYPADVHVHPSGEFVYGSNRGHDSIVAFGVASDGRVDQIGHASTRGEWPRNFAVDPAGEYLYAENRRTDDVFGFRIEDDGTLEPIDVALSVPEPTCMVFVS